MKKAFIVLRYLLPVAILIMIGVLMLGEWATPQQMDNHGENARAIEHARTLYQILILGVLLLVVTAWQLRRLVLNSLGGSPGTAFDLVDRIAAGDLHEDGLQANTGSLIANILKMRGNLRDTLDALHQNTERLSLVSSVFQHAHDGIMITDADANIVEVNPAFTRLTGYAREDVLGQKPSLFTSAHHTPEFHAQIWQALEDTGEWRGEIWNQRKDGDVFAASLNIYAIRDDKGGVSHYVGELSDITRLKEQQQHLEQMAYHDPLTQLPNRTLLSDRLQQALARTERAGDILAVCYLDLDGFKPINDTMGHEAGDELLVELSNRLKASLRAGDTVARLGGDEFALLLCGLQSAEECKNTLDRMFSGIFAPYLIAGKLVKVSASLGFTLFPLDNSTPDTLLRHADQAMYQAKMNGGSSYYLFDIEHDRRSRVSRGEQEAIEAALPRGEFCLYYQPKVNMRHGEVIGAEALIRWEHPEHGMRLPNEFLPAIENTEFAIQLGEWVIHEALRQMHLWQQQGLRLPVSVNIATLHLMQPDFGERLISLLAAWPDVPRNSLELELTETAALEDVSKVSKVIEECHQLGVSFALDDFGTGSSSLAYLKRLPAAVLKIDQTFVRDMLHNADDLAIVEGVIGLSLAFHRHVIAEGVETAEHIEQLLRMGCSLGQGYGIARPMPADAVPSWVAAYAPEEPDKIVDIVFSTL